MPTSPSALRWRASDRGCSRTRTLTTITAIASVVTVCVGIASLSHKDGTLEGLKITVVSALMLSAALCPFSGTACALTGLICTSLLGYNIASFMLGRSDCGCFSAPVPPLATGMLDLVLATWFSLRSGAFYHRFWPAAVAVLSLSLYVGFAANHQRDGISPRSHTEIATEVKLPMRGEQLLPRPQIPRSGQRLLFVYRSSCPRCREKLLDVILTAPPSGPVTPHVQMDVDTGIISDFEANRDRVPDRAAFQALLPRTRNWPVPMVIVLQDGRVVSVEHE